VYKLRFSKLYKRDVDSSYNYIKNYVIFYIIDNDNKHIKIIRFLYNKRNWINILREKQ